jgi:hypothetical protein
MLRISLRHTSAALFLTSLMALVAPAPHATAAEA